MRFLGDSHVVLRWVSDGFQVVLRWVFRWLDPALH